MDVSSEPNESFTTQKSPPCPPPPLGLICIIYAWLMSRWRNRRTRRRRLISFHLPCVIFFSSSSSSSVFIMSRMMLPGDSWDIRDSSGRVGGGEGRRREGEGDGVKLECPSSE